MKKLYPGIFFLFFSVGLYENLLAQSDPPSPANNAFRTMGASFQWTGDFQNQQPVV
jgi:hypothetical protein